MEPTILQRIEKEIDTAAQAQTEMDNSLVRAMGFATIAQQHIDNAKGLLAGTHYIEKDGEIYERA